jgi:PAS domain S-box-containing protein
MGGPKTLRIKVVTDVPPDLPGRDVAPVVKTTGDAGDAVRVPRSAVRKPAGTPSTPAYSRDLLQSIYDAAIVTSYHGAIIDCNVRAQQFFDYSDTELKQLNVLNLIHGASQELMETIHANMERFALIEGHCIRKGGSHFPSEIAVSTLEHSEPERLIFFVRDITRRYQAEEKLLTEHNAIQNAADGILICDSSGAIQSANPALAQLLSLDSAEELTGQSLYAIFHDYEFVQVLLQHAIQEGEAWQGEISLDDSQGEMVLQVSSAANTNIHGERVGLVISVVDITERKQAREKLEQRVAERTRELAEMNSQLQTEIEERQRLQRHEIELQDRLARAERMESLGLLAGGIAHDLNNILGPLVGLPDVLSADMSKVCEDCRKTLARAEKDLEAMDRSALRSAEVIKDLMTLSRRGAIEMNVLDLNILLQGCFDSDEMQALLDDAPDVVVETGFAAEVPTVNGSDVHLARAFNNLMRNAVDAMPQGGRLTITTSYEQLDETLIGHEIIEAGHYVRVDVADTGEGMTPDTLQRVFEPFFTTRRQSRHSGSGLGLSIVHGVIKDHSGFIDIITKPGDGTLVQVYLPVSIEHIEETGVRLEVEGGVEHVLVADDEPGQRFLARRLLEHLGYDVTEASSGAEAVQRVQDAESSGQAVDLVLLDMIMEEGFDGLQALQAMREDFPALKAIIVSGHAQSSRTREAQKLGAGFLAKPYKLKSLARQLRVMLDKA